MALGGLTRTKPPDSAMEGSHGSLLLILRNLQKLHFAFDVRLNQIPEDWHQVAVRFRRANGIRDGDSRLLLW